MADRLFHDRGFGAKHTFNSPTWGCGRLVDHTPRLAGESGRRNSGNAAVVRAAGRDRTRVAHALQPTRPLGSVLQRGLGLEIVFTWRAVVLACAVMSFPLLVRTAQTAFQGVNARFEDIARTLGASEWRVFATISLPLATRGIVAGAVLAFARAMGEFGATAIVAGMIPRKTMTISLSIYQNIQLGHDAAALPLLFVSICVVFITVLCGQIISMRKRPR
jgi:ABC-type molybdate transport system permease subunit